MGHPAGGRLGLHDAEAFAHEALEAGTPDEVVGQLLAGEHGEGGRAGVADHLRRVVDGEGVVLRDGLEDEVHHELKPADEACFFLGVGGDGGGVDGRGRGGRVGVWQSRLLGLVRQLEADPPPAAKDDSVVGLTAARENQINMTERTAKS